jgi:hypothetical protein
MPVTRDQVFISYAHIDQEEIDWIKKLQRHLGLFKRTGAVDVWHDKRIKPGSVWRNEIETALARARVAVLIVGPGFLGSDFIATKELPPLLQAAASAGVRILILVVGYCNYDKSELEPYQTFNDPSKPLEDLTEPQRNKVLSEFSAAIEEAFNRP